MDVETGVINREAETPDTTESANVTSFDSIFERFPCRDDWSISISPRGTFKDRRRILDCGVAEVVVVEDRVAVELIVEFEGREVDEVAGEVKEREDEEVVVRVDDREDEEVVVGVDDRDDEEVVVGVDDRDDEEVERDVEVRRAGAERSGAMRM